MRPSSGTGRIASLILFLFGVLTGCGVLSGGDAWAIEAGATTSGGSNSVWFRVLVPDGLVPAQIGYASYRDGADDVLVFAASLPVRQSALREVTGIGGARVIRLPHATILRLPLAASKDLDVRGAANSFHIIVAGSTGFEPVSPSFLDGRILFPTAFSGPVVVVGEPGRKRPLLIGTVTGPAALRRQIEGPGYRTLPASSGIVVAPLSDDLALNTNRQGFVLTSGGGASGLPIGDPPVSSQRADTPTGSGGLDLPHGTIIGLRHRVEREQRQWAEAPPLDRVRQSLRLARTMLSLDLGPEAHGVLDSMLADDPAAVDDPDRQALMAVSDVLADRPDRVETDWPAHAGDPNARALWRGLAAAEAGHVRTATRRLVDHLALLQGAPVLIRNQLAPLAAEALVRGGAAAAADRLIASMPDRPTVRLIRAEILETSKHPHRALAAYRSLVASENPRVAGIAYFRATMIERALNRISPDVAAARLARHLYDWRGARHELDVRLALARLRAAAGAWPEALNGLTKTRRLFPDQAVRIDALRQRLFDRLMAGGELDRLPVLAAASAIRNNLDLVPSGPGGAPVLLTLAHDLVALDLSDQAAQVLKDALARDSNAQDRARFGAALAGIDLAAQHPHRARDVLAATAGSELDAPIVAKRAALEGVIAAQIGAPTKKVASEAVAADRSTTTASKIVPPVPWVANLGRAQRPSSEAAGAAASGVAIPPTGMLDQAAAHAVLTAAIGAAHDQDHAKLASLRADYLARMPQGRTQAVFAAITAPPLSPKTDLATALAQIAEIERAGTSFGPAGAATSH